MNLSAHTDDHLRRLLDAGTPAQRDAALRELAKRGLESTPEQVAQLKRDRAQYQRLARQADSDWGHVGRGR